VKKILSAGIQLIAVSIGLASTATAQTDRIVIDATTRLAVQVLVRTLDQPNRIVNGKPVPIVVELCNVDLDMTGHSLVIGNDRSLIASPACARGPRRLGPGIFVTDARRADKPLFQIRGDNILFSGFRLEGPTRDIGAGSERLETAIVIAPFESAAPIRNIEISNMEIFHWSGAAVQVTDNTVAAERGRLFNGNEGAVRIRNNFIHHNRHGDGYGYGVNIGGGAYALIERNVFEENRHAIAGDSSDGKKDFSGYTARENLILRGGGLHCSEWSPHALVGWLFNCWQTHQIDMHGDVTTLLGGSWCCGTAGETILIARNTILYDAPIRFDTGYAIKIRGNPADKAVVDGNIFKQPRQDAIGQNGDADGDIWRPIDIRPNNVFGVDASVDIGGCDFFGDGQQDRFMATGVTWWAQSPVTLQWRYLNTMPERLAQLQLRNVDSDIRCDVALRTSQSVKLPRKYSRSGTSPWISAQLVEK
jgi:hypothetical protein